jgi:hypothetical protein
VVNLNKVALYLEYLAFMLRKSTNGKKALAKIMGRVMQASVKVMRSYDYCHFEVALSREVPDGDLDAVNELRKEAAVLVDEAVRQYKVAKDKESRRQGKEWQVRQLLERINHIEKKPASEWTVEEAALMRSKSDQEFWREAHEEDYYYSDPEREHHFSMLRAFKDAKVKAG